MRQRTARRRFLASAGASAAAAAAWLAVGCDSSSGVPDGGPPRATPVAGQPDILNPAAPPRRGGRFIQANAAAFGTFDPHRGVAVASAYFPRMYNVLINQSATKPDFVFLDLAESYEVPDDTTFIFQVRPGVRIAPNPLGIPERDMDAEDVQATMERLRTDPSTNNFAFAGKHIERVAVAASTVRIEMPGPYAWFINRIGLFTNTIPPRELLAGNLDRLNTQGAGGGAYVLQSVAEEDRAIFTRNPNYYRRDDANGGAQLPYIEEIEVRVVYDKTTQLTAFRSGQTHQYMTGSASEVRALADYPVSRDPAFAYIAFTMNHERPPFGDPRVRRAISRAINRQQFVDLVYDGEAQANGLVQWSLGDYALPPDELEQLQPYDLDEARRLVQEVGGVRFTMMYPANTPVLEHDKHLPVFVNQMRQAGIIVDEDPQDFGRWVENLRNVEYQCTLNLNQIYETPEIPLAMHTADGPFGDGTFLRGLGDPEIEAAVAATTRDYDVDERVRLVREAQRVIYAKDPVTLALVTPYQHLVWQHSVKNIPAGIGTSSYLVNTMWMDV